jgi:hypothetical protein
VAKETVARLLRSAGRHAERFHEHEVHDLTPRALEFDEQWSFVKKTETLYGPGARGGGGSVGSYRHRCRQ